ncbi:MAG: polysaccharide biosynthesis/export family protein [Christiangramia sp.]|nr:polysaccharide biosynthesis/export family protein [Christiangramia sp.]
MQAPEDFQARIEVNDVLRIDVSSLNSELVEPFRLDIISESGGGGGQNSNMSGFLVDPEGFITFPVLGKVEVFGLTRGELEQKLTEEIKEYVRDAVVRVRIINFKVTVLGEIGSNVIEVRDERLSVPQAIAMSGDITYDGKKENILVIRTNDGIIEYGRLNMTSAEIFKNPYYYLKQNDIIYVEPTYRKVKSAGFITSWQGLVSIVTTAFSLFILFNR